MKTSENPTPIIRPHDLVDYFEVLLWESWRDNVARFNHFKMQPMPSRETMQGYRRMKAYLESRNGTDE